MLLNMNRSLVKKCDSIENVISFINSHASILDVIIILISCKPIRKVYSSTQQRAAYETSLPGP